VTLGLRFGARSDVGLLRSGNEDAMYAGPRLLAVADGMGGHAAGEVASRVAIEAVAPLDDDLPGSDLISSLRDAVETANDYIRDMVAADNALEGMGTTLTALLSAGQRLGLVHVGDSRAYLLRDGVLHQITHDHTLVQNLVDEGRITPEEANTHPQRSWITRALDGRSTIELDLSVREALAGDRYLLCSDGLTGVVSEDTIAEALRESSDPQEACDRLVELALRGGGPDNVTCIVADVVEQVLDGSPIVGGSAADSKAAAEEAPAADDHPAARAAAMQPRPAPTPEAEAGDEEDEERHQRRGPRRLLVVAALTVLVLVGGFIAFVVVLRHQFYVAPTNAASPTVAIWRGVSGSVAGIDLSHVVVGSDLPVKAIPEPGQSRVRDGIQAKNQADAQRILAELRTEACNAARQAARARAAATRTTSKKPRPKPSPAPLPTYCRTTG